jgi:N-acetyl-alpha-D-muramate 1-phosphate uridylyltransferase
MRAMILAAGRGERLRPLTDRVPKPLIEVDGKSLIERTIERLVDAGFREVVINQGHLGTQLRDTLGEGLQWGIRIHWSEEPPGALETGGGIVNALPLLGSAPFLVVNGDLWTDYPFRELRAVKCDWAHLVLVPNPEHNPHGDFALEGARVRNSGSRRFTFSGICVYHPRLFGACAAGRYSVVPLLRRAIDEHTVTGEVHRGEWVDIGNLERLESLRQRLAASRPLPG